MFMATKELVVPAELNETKVGKQLGEDVNLYEKAKNAQEKAPKDVEKAQAVDTALAQLGKTIEEGKKELAKKKDELAALEWFAKGVTKLQEATKKQLSIIKKEVEGAAKKDEKEKKATPPPATSEDTPPANQPSPAPAKSTLPPPAKKIPFSLDRNPLTSLKTMFQDMRWGVKKIDTAKWDKPWYESLFNFAPFKAFWNAVDKGVDGITKATPGAGVAKFIDKTLAAFNPYNRVSKKK